MGESVYLPRELVFEVEGGPVKTQKKPPEVLTRTLLRAETKDDPNCSLC